MPWFVFSISCGVGLQLQQESVPIQEVFAVLKASPHGLTSTDGASRLQIFGPNKLEEKKVLSPDRSRSIKNRSAIDLTNVMRN